MFLQKSLFWFTDANPQMQTHHLNIVEHQPLYGGDVLGGDRGEIRSDLEAGRVGIGPTEDSRKMQTQLS